MVKTAKTRMSKKHRQLRKVLEEIMPAEDRKLWDAMMEEDPVQLMCCVEFLAKDKALSSIEEVKRLYDLSRLLYEVATGKEA